MLAAEASRASSAAPVRRAEHVTLPRLFAASPGAVGSSERSSSEAGSNRTVGCDSHHKAETGGTSSEMSHVQPVSLSRTCSRRARGSNLRKSNELRLSTQIAAADARPPASARSRRTAVGVAVSGFTPVLRGLVGSFFLLLGRARSEMVGGYAHARARAALPSPP